MSPEVIQRRFWQHHLAYEIPNPWLCGVRHCGQTTLAESLSVERLREIAALSLSKKHKRLVDESV